jgi:hypothetical protein
MSSTNLESLAAREDVEIVGRRLDAMENKMAPPLDLAGYVERPELDFVAKRVDAVITEAGVLAGRIAAIETTAPPTAASINDPALADFKQSVMDEVKKMLAGGTKTPPPDIDWTDCLTGTGGTQNQVQARLLGGFVELRGVRTFSTTNTSFTVLRLPANFPLAETTANYVIAAREAGVAARYTYVYVGTTDRNIGITMAGAINEASFGGLRWKAAY